MPSYFARTRAAVRGLFARAPEPAVVRADSVAPVDDDLMLVDGKILFTNPERAATDSSAWLVLFEAALERNSPVGDEALQLVLAQAARFSAEELLWGKVERARFLGLLRPRPGIAMRLAEMRTCGLLAVLLPEFYGAGTDTHSISAVDNLERLLGASDLSGSRFGTMLGELSEPALVVLALLLHMPMGSKEHSPQKAVALAQSALDRLRIEGDTRHTVEFLIDSQLKMSEVAFRRDMSDPDVLGRFAAVLNGAAQFSSLSAEEHLKMLCLLTVADLGAGSRDSLTSWKAELLWRLFVDAYNHLTLAYGDDVIDRDAAARTVLHRNRPPDIAAAELVQFLEGLPQRYLTLFDPDRIYQHVRLWRNLGADDVRAFLQRKAEASELTAVARDKPYLFSNICGTLAAIGADILRGQAFTSRDGLALDVFEFADRTGAVSQAEIDRLLADVVAGRVDILARLSEQHRAVGRVAFGTPLLHFDNDCSARFTVLEVVAHNAPGLLYCVSQALSSFGCEVDLVLINTEGDQAIDVFHLRRDGAKLSDSDQLALTAQLEQAFDASP